MQLNEISGKIVDCAIKVHKRIGPGLLESTYETCLIYELRKAGLKVETQVPLPIIYDDIKLEAGYRIDILVEDSIIVELKSVEALIPIHEAQLLTYLRLANKKIGLLINFNVALLKNGIRRIIN
jgi:GxxExxY protein